MSTEDPQRYKLTDEENKSVFEKHIARIYLADIKPVENPKAVVLGGQPGAGKTLVMDEATKELARKGNTVAIVGDDLRGYHPKYRELSQTDPKNAAFYTDQDSGQWVERLIEAAKEKRANLVIEGTMRLPEKVEQTLSTLKSAGYEVEARAMAVNERMSWQGVHTRFERLTENGEAARFTQKHTHDAGAAGMLKTLDHIEQNKLADKVVVQSRAGTRLYENELKGGEWAKTPAASEAVQKERQRPRSPDEADAHHEGWAKVVSAMKRRGAEPEAVEKVERQQKADAYAFMPREMGAKRYPDLANAYAAVKLTELAAEQKGATREAAKYYGEAMKEALTTRIEKGEKLPTVQLKAHDQARDQGPER